ncbi:MAG: nicotinate-nucleotide--dimethylbenzimidazole phosphoribosyltransferase [Firmicutes bacterium]|nr:nicotinate-nucleotide--dimethylbenzimidazole phosphoribosyltransferase [Bacillota bacterium]
MFDLQKVLSRIDPLNEEAMAKTQARLDDLTKPRGSLGVMELIAKKIAGITGQAAPTITKKTCILMAGDHGVVKEGYHTYSQAVTAQMVQNFLNGGAAMNVFSRHVGAELLVVDIGVATDFNSHPLLLKKKIAYGTQNMSRGPAMTTAQALKAIETGFEVAEECLARGSDLLGLGEMGIGNTTPSTALLAVFSGSPVKKITGRGTGASDELLKSKIRTIERALEVNKPTAEEPLAALAKVGGLEIAGLIGVILAGAANRVPVVLDGFISGAAALVASALHPNIKDYLLASHLSDEPGHEMMLKLIGVRPVLFMDMRLGEGTGAALSMHVIEASVKILHEMATFSGAGISGPEKK